MRRSEMPASKELIFEDLVIDPVNYLIKLNEKVIELPKKEFETIYLLASKARPG
jgi:DNA-binding response OmpR family regulator